MQKDKTEYKQLHLQKKGRYKSFELVSSEEKRMSTELKSK